MRSYLRLTGGRKLQSPKGIGTRPTTSRVREAVMNLIGPRIQGSNWLDICSGSGVMSCEALQRGAKRVLAIEKDKQTAKICKSNLMTVASALIEKKSVEVICQEVISLLKKGCNQYVSGDEKNSQFDLVYFDPPYGSKMYSIVLEQLLEGNWLKQDSLVICEHSSSIELDVPDRWIEQGKKVYGNSALLILSSP